MNDSKPAALTTAHKILISSGILLGLLFTGFSAYRGDNLVAAATALFTVTLGIYLRWFLQKAKQ